MLLPNGDLYPFITFRKDLVAMCNDAAEILFLLDGCQPEGLGLPYCLDPTTSTFRLTNTQHLALPIIICITSLGSHGSELLIEGVNNLAVLTRNLNAAIHCSYPIKPVLWSWLYNGKYSIYVNDPTSSLVVERVVWL